LSTVDAPGGIVKRPPGCPPATATSVASGFTLIELLVTAAVLAVVLAAAYGWVWSVGSLAGTTDDHVQASTIAAALVRTIREDVGSAVAVVAPAAGRDPARSLALVHDGVDEAPEGVLTVWDPVRDVVWRNASGTYVADHVTALSVGFVLADGQSVDGEVMTAANWESVVAVRVALEVEVGAALVRRDVYVGVGSL
jgi:prepilin-type N-terminal cleavage/methylation domain-containing protein